VYPGAIENECYVVAAAQYGQHNPKRASYGHACVVDPWGSMTVQLSDKEPDLGVTEIEDQYIKDVRQRIPNWEHRRPDIYSSQVVIYASNNEK
jgi:deaminated glutathione amidase